MQKKHLTGILAALVLALLAGAEIYARKGLGLGDPPLSVADPEIEYLFAPNQDCPGLATVSATTTNPCATTIRQAF